MTSHSLWLMHVERLGDPVEGAESRIAQVQTSWSLALLSDFSDQGRRYLGSPLTPSQHKRPFPGSISAFLLSGW